MMNAFINARIMYKLGNFVLPPKLLAYITNDISIQNDTKESPIFDIRDSIN